MSGNLEQLERELDRQIAELGERLRAPAPGPACLARVTAAVDAENRRLQRRGPRLALLRVCIGAAAAMLLGVGLSVTREAVPVEEVLHLEDDPEVAVTDWVDAMDESEERFTRLFEDQWLFEGLERGGNDAGESADPLKSVEESLESFEQMIEA